MDISTIDDVIDWINRQRDWAVIGTPEVVRAAEESDLPADAKQAICDLPVGIYSRADLVAEVRELMIPHIKR